MPCMQCDHLDQKLREVKHALRSLDESQARGPEYFEEHEKLERRREEVLEEISRHRATHA
jgi:hypothetical protein